MTNSLCRVGRNPLIVFFLCIMTLVVSAWVGRAQVKDIVAEQSVQSNAVTMIASGKVGDLWIRIMHINGVCISVFNHDGNTAVASEIVPCPWAKK